MCGRPRRRARRCRLSLGFVLRSNLRARFATTKRDNRETSERLTMKRAASPLASAFLIVALATSCQERTFHVVIDGGNEPNPDAPVGGMGGGGTGGFVPPLPDGGLVVPDAGPCTKVTCEAAGGVRYCGQIGYGCGGLLDCAGCPTGQVCGGAGTNQVCGAVDPGCVPKTCDQVGGKYCGKIGDGCGKALECGGCPAGETCSAVTPNVCGKAGPCTPLTCDQAGGKFCGVIGDGCGKMLDCPDCTGGLTCGGDGTPHVCGGTMTGCVAQTCDVTGGRFCGKIGDNCGHSLDCGDCPLGSDTTCGGAGTPGACGKAPDPNCMPKSCTQTGGNYCGKIGDGCNRTIDCGACPTGQTCNNGICQGASGCAPLTCTVMGGQYCGMIGDGCGHGLNCSAPCPAGETCGGGGTPNVCGKSGACTPVVCMQATGQYCGMNGDGCGKMKDCGACPAGQTCGGSGIPGVCGSIPVGCMKTQCTQSNGQYCGVVGDNCGGSIDCGACTKAGDTCGGGGIPSVCGSTPAMCTPMTCTPPGGQFQYCGAIGDGCNKPQT